MTPDFVTECGRATLYRGDCLNVIPELEGIDAFITDPPYSSGGMYRGDRTRAAVEKYVNSDSLFTCRTNFGGDNRDQRAFFAWATFWLSFAFHVSKPGAIAICFSDWRQLPVMTDSLQAGGWIWRNIATWWKPGVRMQRGRFSSSAEYVICGSNGIPTPGEASPQNVFECPVVDSDDKTHIAEKPLPVMKWLVSVTPKDALVVDPFMGSGTTALAALDGGRRFIGIEGN